MEQAVGIAQMAKVLNVSSDTVRRQAKSGDIPAFKVGNLWRFEPEAVVAHLKKESDPWKYTSRRAT